MTGLVARAVSAGWGADDVLRDVSFEAAPGQLLVVLGPNGAGKSTLVRVLAGLLPPRRGQVVLDGTDLASLSRAAVARRVAVVPQTNHVAEGFSVREVVAMGRAPHQSGWLRLAGADAAVVERALVACELTDLAQRDVATLSGGEQQRVSIARALAQQADVLLLDEPAAHLDVRHVLSTFELVGREIAERSLVAVAVLHDLNVAAQFGDRILLMRAGGVVAHGTVEEVMTYRRLKEVFEAELFVGVNELDGARYFLPVRPRPRD